MDVNFGLFYVRTTCFIYFPSVYHVQQDLWKKKTFCDTFPLTLLASFCEGNLIGGDSSDCLCITDIEVAACVHCAIERTALLLTMLCNDSTELVSYKKWQIWQIYVLSYFMGFLGYEYECM